MKKRLCSFIFGLSVFGFSAMPSVLAVGPPSMFTSEDEKLILAYGDDYKKKHPSKKNIGWKDLIENGFDSGNDGIKTLSRNFSNQQLSLKYLKHSMRSDSTTNNRVNFTDEDDQKIIEYIISHTNDRLRPNWNYVASLFNGKFDRLTCFNRWDKFLKYKIDFSNIPKDDNKSGVKTNFRFTKEDDKKIMAYAKEYLKNNLWKTPINWAPLANELSRDIGFEVTEKQILKRYDGYLKNTEGQKEKWTKEMDYRLLVLASLNTTENKIKWQDFAAHFPGYSKNSLYAKYRRLISKNKVTPEELEHIKNIIEQPNDGSSNCDGSNSKQSHPDVSNLELEQILDNCCQ